MPRLSLAAALAVLLRIVVLVIGVAAVSGTAWAQFYYGKNKVQYTDFDWQVMSTRHFRIYFYTEEAEVAQIAARIAEDHYPKLAARFNHEVKHTIPLIIYSSPSYFSQTNVVPDLLPESVGGFTEFLKGRVVVPFHGSYFDFEHVIVHELVHVFMISRLEAEVARQRLLRPAYPPLWFTEGIAEHWSEEWDPEADMILADLVINDQLLTIDQFWQVQGSYFMYKLGQSVCRFITDHYGPEKLTLLFDNWTKGRDFDEIVKYTLGDDLKELSRKWEYDLKKRHFPTFAEYGLPSMESDRLTYDGYAVKGAPIKWDDGSGPEDWVIYMAYRRGYTGIYMKPRRPNKDRVKCLVKGERSSRFESLHLLRSGIDATRSGLVVFSSKSKEQDVIYIYSLREERITAEYRFPELVAARSPRFSRDERSVVFSGIRKSGYTDLYVINLSTGQCRAVTDDIYYDTDPCFSLDGESIVFVSDRGGDGRHGATNLFRVSSDGQDLNQLTWGDAIDQTPDVTDKGIFFASDRDNSNNLYLLDSTGQITRQSTYVTGAFDPRLSDDGRDLIYSGYQETQFRIYQMKLLEEPVAVVSPSDSAPGSWRPEKIDTLYSRTSVTYQTDYSFDIAQSAIAYDPIYGSAGGLQASFSDILGNHAFYMLLTNTADTRDEFFRSFNFGLTYVNREKRLNWGLGAFHLYDEYYNDRDQYFYERQAGGVGFLSYPVSKFSRVDFASYLRYDHKDRRYGLEDRKGVLASTFVSWAYDNAIWDISGPIEGRRYNLTLGLTQSISDGLAWNRIGYADIRHYLRLGRASAFANRMFAYYSGGLEPQRIYFGGSWNFRGFDRRAFYTRKILFASNELRFPLIDALLIGFPIGGLDFRAIRGALFFDTGSAWDDEFDQFIGSYGFGFRVSLGYVVLLRFDFARTTDFHTTSPNFDFDFFFGWNF